MKNGKIWKKRKVVASYRLPVAGFVSGTPLRSVFQGEMSF